MYRTEALLLVVSIVNILIMSVVPVSRMVYPLI
jgi:hypothetical protein